MDKKETYLMLIPDGTNRVFGPYLKENLSHVKKQCGYLQPIVMEESLFKQVHPARFKQHFTSNWFQCINSFLLSSTWISSFEVSNCYFYSDWFVIYRHENQQELVVRFKIGYDPYKAGRLVHELICYSTLPVLVAPSFFELTDGKIAVGDRAVALSIAAKCVKESSPN